MAETATPTAVQQQAARRRQIVQDALGQLSHIATLPEITLRIIEVVEDPESTAHDLHRIIANDPALCARILKVVNSAFYGLPGQIGSLNRAIVLLGLNAVKNIAIAASLARLIRGGPLSASVSPKDLWTHSIAVGAAVKLIAEQRKMNLPDEAFLAGLIHDIGLMVEMQTHRAPLAEALDMADGGDMDLVRAERRAIGADHQDFGKGLCEHWKFPRSFAYVAGYHHDPLALAASSRMLTAMVHLGDVLAARREYGFTTALEPGEIDPDVLDAVEITQSQVDEVDEQLPEAYEVADQLLR